VVVVMERYLASADDLKTVTCFLFFHDMSDLLKKIQYPVTEHLVKGHRAQFASQYAIKCSGPFKENNNPRSEALLR
jgi:hypothetical protein